MRRAKARSVARKAANRQLAARFIIVSEGEVTEREYFRKFGEIFGHRDVRLSVVGGAGDPRSVVERAIEKIQELQADAREKVGAKDVVWAVFDRDEHKRFYEALNLAIPVAMSNPCFELWGIYHYQDYDAPVDRHDCQRILEGLCAGYDRKNNKSFAIDGLIRDACEKAVERGRASLVSREQEGNPGASPCTSVHLLVEEFCSLSNRLGKQV